MSLSPPLYRAQDVKALDRVAIDQHGIAGFELMQRAALALFDDARAHYPASGHWLIAAGAGNNAGDGYLVGRLALQAGLEVCMLALKPVNALSGDAATAAAAFLQSGGSISPVDAVPWESVDLVIDALLGTGLERPVAGDYAALVDTVNRSGRPVVAVDIPSGLCADTGRVLGVAVRADRTVTFIGRKRGLYTADGPDHAGNIVFDDLQVPPEVYESVPVRCREITARADWGAPRPAGAHKGDYGHIGIVGGAAGMSGAALLAGSAALRAGAGLVTLFSHPDHAAWINLSRPELMTASVSDPAELVSLTRRATVLAAGPGLGREAWGRAAFEYAVNDPRPLVLDADGLNWLAENPRVRRDWVLTPHPGEAARLLGSDVDRVQADRFAAAREIAVRYGAVVVLKGNGTLVCADEKYAGDEHGSRGGPMGLCRAGNPGMASAGMGDVLTGVIAALLGSGMPIYQAASAGVFIHATTADLAAVQLGEAGLIAGDVIDALPAAWLSLSEHLSER